MPTCRWLTRCYQGVTQPCFRRGSALLSEIAPSICALDIVRRNVLVESQESVIYAIVSFVMQRLKAALRIEPFKDDSLRLKCHHSVVGMVYMTEYGDVKPLEEHPAFHSVQSSDHGGKATLNVFGVHE